MLLAMLAIAESHMVQQYGRSADDPDLNSGAFASRASLASANSSARNFDVQAILADPSFVIHQMETLLTHVVGSPQLQEEIRALSGKVAALMADPLQQYQAALVAEQLEKEMVDTNLQEQAKQLLEQAVSLVTEMQTMMTHPSLQGEAERFAKQMEEDMANPRLHEHVRCWLKQLEAMTANINFQGQATSFAQLMEALIADRSFQRHVRQIAAHVEAIRDHLTSQKTDGGPTLDLFSLAEVSRSSSEVSFAPPRYLARMPVAAASRSAASQHLRRSIPLSEPQLSPGVSMPPSRHIAARSHPAPLVNPRRWLTQLRAEDPSEDPTTGPHVLPVKDEEEYNALVQDAAASNRRVVLKFYASWCRACKAMAPKFERVAKEYAGEFEFHELLFDTNQALVRKKGIKVLPYIEIIVGSKGVVDEFTCGASKVPMLKSRLEAVKDDSQEVS